MEKSTPKNAAENACYELLAGGSPPENGTPGAELFTAFSTIKDDIMPTATRKPRTRKPASTNRVKQILTELTYRLHATKVVGRKPESAPR